MQKSVDRHGRNAFIVVGFGTAAAMWAIGYIAHLPFLNLPPSATLALMVLVMLGGGYFAGKHCQRGLRDGIYAGLVFGTINLLMVGSLMGSDAGGEEFRRSAPIWLFGTLAASALLGAIGAAIGAGRKSDKVCNWNLIFSVVAAASTLLLLMAGGLVTSMKAGMAVPDWPSSYGYNMFLYPLTKMTGGIYYEHSHRLLGTLVGLIAIGLALWLQNHGRSKHVKALAWVALVAVIIQGIFGGVRVTENAIVLAIVHGVLGQGVFALFACLAAMNSNAWQEPEDVTAETANSDRKGAMALLILIIIQVALGSLLRHIDFSWHLHATVAVIVIIFAGMIGIRISSRYGEQSRVLKRAGKSVMHIAGMQFILGWVALMPHLDVVSKGLLDSPLADQPDAQLPMLYIVTATSHQVVGALLFAFSAMLVVWCYRLLRQGEGTNGQAEA